MLKDSSINFRHSLANKLTFMRIQLEKFLLDDASGRLIEMNDKEKLKEAIELIDGTIDQIDAIWEHFV